MHHIQKSIINRLAFEDSLRFSELQPDEVENKLFDYHLKQLLRDKLIEKNHSGNYCLTAEGKQAGIRALTANRTSIKAHSVLFLAMQNSSGKWLLYRRLVHPLKDRVGFMHASPIPGESSTQTASKELLEKTGLTASFEFAGSGFFTMTNDQDVESYTHFVVLKANKVSGQLNQNHDRAEYFWANAPDFGADDMLPNMSHLVEQLQTGKEFFTEKTFNL